MQQLETLANADGKASAAPAIAALKRRMPASVDDGAR